MQFLKGLVSEPDGKPSFARMIAGILILAVIGWISYCVIRNSAIPDLAGLTLFLSSILAIVLGINKAPAIIDSVKATPTPQTEVGGQRSV